MLISLFLHTHTYSTHTHTHTLSHTLLLTHTHTLSTLTQFGDMVDFLCKCSFLEIYNEQVYDLLDPASCGLHLRENIKHGVYVDGLSEVSVSCARDAYEVLSTGWVNRKVASTSMNRESSRSHAVFTLTIESKKRVRSSEIKYEFTFFVCTKFAEVKNLSLCG